ncbi:patatin-like phospholipase family protein [Pararhizobium sp. LjRoot238]
MVAGVSTGALQATPAFLGPAYDALLERVYTNTRTRDVFRSNGLKTLFGAGYYNTAPLRRLLSDLVTEDMLDAVASAHRSGRRLYVATTDMSAGRVVYWDMGAIASSGTDRKRNYIDVLLASVAVPGLVEPIRVSDRRRGTTAIHSDGAIKTPVPLEPFMLNPAMAYKTDVWVLVNGHVSRDAALRSDARNTFGLARRGMSQLFRQLLYFSTVEAELKTRLAGARFNLIVLPDTFPETLNPVNFNPAEMKLLFERGREIGKTRFSRLRPKERSEARLMLNPRSSIIHIITPGSVAAV